MRDKIQLETEGIYKIACDQAFHQNLYEITWEIR